MKYHGRIGFAVQTETSPGVWTEEIIEREYGGDLLRFNRKTQQSGKVNDDIVITNEISIIADAYLNQNLYALRYVTFMGCKWKADSLMVEYPRINISLGGLYNGQPS